MTHDYELLKEIGWQEVMPRYVCIPMSAIEIVQIDGDYISLPHSAVWPEQNEDSIAYFNIYESFINSFLKMFDITSTKKGSLGWHTYFEFMKKQFPDKIVKIYLDISCAHCVAMIDEKTTPISADIALDLYEWMDEQRHDVSELQWGEETTEFVVLNKNTFQLFKSNHGIYRLGGMVSIPHFGTTVKIKCVLEHSSSNSLAIINNKAASFIIDVSNQDSKLAVRDIADALQSISRSKEPSFKKLVIERLQTSRKTIASISECLKVGGVLDKLQVPNRASFMELHDVLDFYGIAAPGNNQTLLSTSPTHIDRLQLFHLIVSAKSPDVRAQRIYAGDFLFSVGDLEGTNTKRLWTPDITKPKSKPKPEAVKPKGEVIDLEELWDDDDCDTETEDLMIDDSEDLASDFNSETAEITDDGDIMSDLGD